MPELVARLLLTQDLPSFLDDVADLLERRTVGLLHCTLHVHTTDVTLLNSGRHHWQTATPVPPSSSLTGSPAGERDGLGGDAWDTWGPWRPQAGSAASARLDLPLLTTSAGPGLQGEQVGVLTLYARDRHAISLAARHRLHALAVRAACAALIALPPAAPLSGAHQCAGRCQT